MDPLEQIINNLKKEEIRSFKIFTNRFNRSEDVKIATLFDKLRNDKYEGKEEKLVSELFPDDPHNMNAFYRLKNRLKTELEKSLLNLHHNLDDKITTINLITLANLFAYKSNYELSVYYFRKAEKIAQQNELYVQLDLIYNELITLSKNFNGINPIECIEKRKENAQKHQLMMQVNHDIAAILYTLRKTNRGKMGEDLHAMLQGVLTELNVANEVYNIPTVKFNIYFCIRDILLQDKAFDKLEEYLKDTLVQFEEENLFNKSTFKTKLGLITWIINTLIINRKWDDALHYTEMLHEELNKYNKLYYDTFIWTYYQSLITNYISSNRLPEAIELLERIKELPAHKGNTFYDYAIYVNLSLCYYFSNNQSTAIKTLSHLFTREIYPKLSAELQFSISILEQILHYDNKNYDFVTYRIGEMKRHFRSLLKRPDYQEEKNFIKILLAMSNRADPLHDKLMLNQINNFINEASSLQVGSSKHIDYGIWLKSKINKKPYYQSLLQSLQAPAKQLH